MPEIGEIQLAKYIGRKGTHRYMWQACIDCGKEHWVHAPKNIPSYKRCKACDIILATRRLQELNRGKHPKIYKGGFKTLQGYKIIYLCPSDFFAPMVNKTGYVAEHRLIMAKSLGRCLHRWEIVHHKNHTKDDNRIDNLQLVSDDRHKQITIMENRIRLLENRIIKLEVENVLLKESGASTVSCLVR